MKIKSFIIYALVFVTMFSACKDDLVDKYTDPEKATEASIPGFFAAMLNHDRVRPSYWNVRTMLLISTGVNSQTNYFSNSIGKYQINTSYTGQYWNSFYINSNGSGPLGLYRAMETAYANLSDEEKAEMDIFMEAGKVFVIDMASKMVDLWGDIPYTEVGSLITSSTIEAAAYDDQEALYTEFISDLGAAATYFASASTDATFSKYDILSSGSIDKWQRYANSLRLRLLMRISNSDESTAKSTVTTMLSNSASYPLLEDEDILLEPLTDYTNSLHSALVEVGGHYAPDYMLNTLMLPYDDPRIPAMFDKYGTTEDGVFVQNENYGAMSVSMTSAEASQEYMNYSILDSATFLMNSKLPGIVMTASEVSFLKAEAYERWSLGDSQTAFEEGVRESVDFYYYLNNLNESGLTTLSYPATSEVDDFISTLDFASKSSTEQLEMIYDQKWLQLGFLQSIEAWSEYRRTGYPALTFEEDTKSGYETPATRLLYPDDEKDYNSENYSAVKGEDTRDTKIFWDVD